MTVQSLSYLLFVLLIWVLARPLRSFKARQWLLLIASYIFYASWGISFLALLLGSSLMNYWLGAVLRRQPDARRLWLGITFNVLLLCLFKYLLPLAGGAQQNAWFGGALHWIVMPVGISFWTFQALSYLFDTYREEDLDPTLLEFCLYMAFWPAVLAGPVCRLPNMLPQFRQTPKITWEDLSVGTHRLVTGLFMKLVLAQILLAGLSQGEGIAAGFDQIARGWGAIDVWMLALGFGFQLFFDFAGYSHIVIGTARLFGLELEENFDRPYLSTNPSMFWTRWHMSLSFWIRDYVFLPLATMRRERQWRLFALVLAMTLFGLWHGATVLFLMWGAYHGLLLVGHRQVQQLGRRFQLTLPFHLGAVLSWGVTFALISLGWIFFRAHDLQQAMAMLGAVFTPGSYRQLALRANFYIVTALVIGGYFIYTGLEYVLSRVEDNVAFNRALWLLSPLKYTVILFFIIAWSKQEEVFVYFQF